MEENIVFGRFEQILRSRWNLASHRLAVLYVQPPAAYCQQCATQPKLGLNNKTIAKAMQTAQRALERKSVIRTQQVYKQ
ncbi:hypothetical protein OSTOST_20371, partial [Ostertagia ostertagi]